MEPAVCLALCMPVVFKSLLRSCERDHDPAKSSLRGFGDTGEGSCSCGESSLCGYAQHECQAASLLPSNRARSSIVHSLANALGFFRPDILPNLRALKPSPASASDICAFHDSEYIGRFLGINSGVC